MLQDNEDEIQPNTTQFGERECIIKGCFTPVSCRSTFCRKHWYMVPDHLRLIIITKRMPAYDLKEAEDAISEAITYINSKEGR